MGDWEWNAITITLTVLLVLVVVLGLAIWSMRRHREPVLQIEGGDPIEEMMSSLAGLALSTVVPGNSVELFENGAYFDVLVDEIKGAKHTVHFETFLWKKGCLGQRVADALSERARAGVKVRVLVDGNGGRGMGKEVVEQLKDSGCHLARFHDAGWKNIGVLNDRDHRKLVVLDGRVALVGGHCIVDSWLGDAQDNDHFADLSVRLRGPIVHSVQAAFSENWGGSTGEVFAGEDVFPVLEPAGEITGFAAYAKPAGSAPAVKLLHHTVICLARKRLWIQNPYFIPEPEAIEAFGKAVKRGVDVRVLMPSTSGSDNPMVQHAGHRNFDRLLSCGVRLFEYPHTLLHQKVMTVDEVWCAIGSSNFDDRSFETNDEITLALLDSATTKTIDGIFEKYAAKGQEIKLAQWRKRSVWHKVQDRLAYIPKELL